MRWPIDPSIQTELTTTSLAPMVLFFKKADDSKSDDDSLKIMLSPLKILKTLD